MSIPLARIVGDIHEGRKTGVLTVLVKGGNHLLKMFFRNGEVYYLTCGNLRNTECVDNINSLELGDCVFLPGVKMDAKAGPVPSTAELIQQLRTSAKMVESRLVSGGSRSTGKEDSDDAKTLEEIKVALIRQIGPAGAKVMSRIVADKWQAPMPFTKEDIERLIDLLQNEIDDQNGRKTFIREANKGR
jgi:hypothetical protein